MADVKNEGGSEEAYLLYYRASDYHRQGGSGVYAQRDMHYKDRVGRDKNNMELCFYIQRDAAQEVIRECKRDPTFIRKLLEITVEERYSKSARDVDILDRWEEYQRPPYDAWNAYPEPSRMYIADLVEDPTNVPDSLDDIDGNVVDFRVLNPGSGGLMDDYAEIVHK